MNRLRFIRLPFRGLRRWETLVLTGFVQWGKVKSTLRGGGDVPFRILWDTSRFQSRTFRHLLEELEQDNSYITMRERQSAEETARFCDGSLGYQITWCDMSARLDPQESIEQLRAEAFNPDHNVALAGDNLKHLRECLEEIARREQTTVYGRNFYYSVWGYGHTRMQREIEANIET